MINKQVENLMHQVRELEAHLPDKDKSNAAVSTGSIGWHIEHSLLVMEQVIDALKRSDPAAYKRKFHPLREVVFIMNKFPRGKGKAPRSTIPKGSPSEEELGQKLKKALAKISDLMDIPHSHYFTHPYFGDIKYERTIRFLNMHTRHHLKIIHDILKSSN